MRLCPIPLVLSVRDIKQRVSGWLKYLNSECFTADDTEVLYEFTYPHIQGGEPRRRVGQHVGKIREVLHFSVEF